MIRNLDELCHAIHAETHGRELLAIKAEYGNKLSRLFYLSRLMRRYFAAEIAAPKFGYIGVGAISFAEFRMQEFQRRTN